MRAVIVAVLTLSVAQLALTNWSYNSKAKERDCSGLDPDILKEIRSHQPTVNKIIDYVVNGKHSGKTYEQLEEFVDTFGARMSGTQDLEDAIDWVVDTANQEGFDVVKTKEITVPHWVRNEESATMVEPRVQKLSMLGLGGSVGTPPEGVTAEVIAVRDFDELAEKGDMVAGKIVVFNQEYYSYGKSAKYRQKGASEAAKYGAVAALVRSITDHSIGSPHTGQQTYDDDVEKIPVACISSENAQMIYRLCNKHGKTVKIKLVMGAENLPDRKSRNTFIDINGADKTKGLLVVSGHIDSWDVGAGAMDDAGGCFISYNALVVLKRLGLRSQRKLCNIWFSGEEQGVYGGKEFFESAKGKKKAFQMLMESDGGTFAPKGIGFYGSETATCIIQEIVKLTAAINTTEVIVRKEGPDIGMWPDIGVPIGSLLNEREHYFWYHHSEGDGMELEETDVLDRITALWASVAYVAADISVNLQDV